MKKIFTLFAALAMVMSMSAKPYLRGSFNGWGTGNEFQNGECTMNLSANTEYEFKVDQNGDWGTSYGNATITSSKCSNIKLSSGNNAKITTALKGDYKFTWNASNQTLTVAYPTEEVVKPKKDITVKAKMPAHWTKTIDAWVWTDEDGKGKAVTPERDGDWYVITQNTAASYIIFRNGATWSGDANQTVDMRFEDNACIQLAQSGSAKATYTNIDCVSEFTLTATANPAEGGSVTGAGVYEEGTTVTLTATPNEGYEFVSWTNGGAEVSTNATYSFVIKANMALVANFKAEEATVYTISTEAVNGTVTGAGVYEEGATVTLTATPADGYNFKNWTVSGAEVSAENPYIFTATADVTVTANFEEIPVEYETVYFVNAQKWAGTINAYAWTDGVGDNHAWPGLPATKETEQIAGCDVYSYTAEAGTYAKVIFNNGTNKTDDLEWTAGKYYVGNEWLTKEEAEDALNKPVVITYVLMGVNDDWTTGIAMTVNPENANEYVLFNQPIAEGDSVKVVTLTNGVKTAYCGNVKEGVTVTITPDDKSGNIILAPGNYNFYYDVTTDNIWIAAVSETPGTPDTPATYYITGNDALLGDKAWNPDAIAMTEVEGVYTHTFTAVAAGVECQLKVTKGDWVNGVWGYDNLSNTPDGVTTDNDRNIIFTLAEDGDVLVTFSEEKITITGNFAVSDEPQVITYVLMGVNDDWTTGIAMTVNPENANEYMLLNQPIAEGDSVKVVTLTNGEKTAYCGNVKDGVTVTITPDDKSGNIILAPGNYNFYYDVTTNNIWIAAVSETPGTPGTPDTPATYYITGNETLLGDKAWNPDAIAMTEVEGVYTHTFTAVAAGVECQLKVTKGDWVNGVWGYDNLSNTPDGVTTDNDRNIIFTLAEDGDVLVTFDGEKITVEGNFAVSDEPQVITYVLMGVGGDWKTGIALTQNPNNDGEYVLLGQTISEGDAVKVVTLNNGTATAWCGNVDEYSVAHSADDKGNIVLAPGKYDFYFKLNDPATADDDIIYIGLSKTTALDNVNTTVAPVKAIVNGQLVIIRNGVKYNVQGAVVK